MAVDIADQIAAAGDYPSKDYGARERKLIKDIVEYVQENAAADGAYAPNEAGDWETPDPATIAAALDQLAQRVTDEIYAPAVSADWDTPPTAVSAALDELAARVKVLEGV